MPEGGSDAASDGSPRFAEAPFACFVGQVLAPLGEGSGAAAEDGGGTLEESFVQLEVAFSADVLGDFARADFEGGVATAIGGDLL